MLEKYSNHYKLCIVIYSILLSMKTLFKVNAHICYILLDLVRISVITADFSYSIHRFLNILYAYLLCKEAVQRKAQYVCGVTTSVYPTHQTYYLVQQMRASLMICHTHYQLSSRKTVREQLDMFGFTSCM